MIDLRTLAVAAGLVLGASGIASAQDRFVLGFNQAWLEGKYASSLSGTFAEEDWGRILRRTREGGASTLRVWLFEGQQKEGIVWNGHEPTGVDPTYLANVRRLVALAASNGVRLYWTAGNGNWPDHWQKKGLERDRHWNLLQNRYGHGDLFRERCLGPVLDAIRERPEALYALDLMNEAEGAVKTWAWSEGWDGARRYFKASAGFVHRRAPGLKVTASAGWGDATRDILAGRFDGLGLDFLDVHVYTDQETLPRGAELVAHARKQGVPIIVGELGQDRSKDDPAHQARVTRGLLEDARRLGFAGAFAWRLEDRQPDGKRFSFFDGDRPRPAYEEMRKFAATLPPEAPGPAKSSGLVGGVGEAKR